MLQCVIHFVRRCFNYALLRILFFGSFIVLRDIQSSNTQTSAYSILL